jgi:hypothetical protein
VVVARGAAPGVEAREGTGRARKREGREGRKAPVETDGCWVGWAARAAAVTLTEVKAAAGSAHAWGWLVA